MKWEKATCSEEAHHQDGCGVSSRSPQNRIHSDRIISISQRGLEGRDPGVLNEVPYADWSRTTKSVVSQAAYGEGQAVIQTPAGPQRMNYVGAAPAYFGIFGVRPLIGRTFDESETKPGGPRVIVLSEPLWRELFGADPAAIDRTVTFDGRPRLVIGVLPAAPVSTAAICFVSSIGSSSSLVRKDRMEVCSLSREVMLPGIAQLLFAPLQSDLRFFHPPLPALLWACLTARLPCAPGRAALRTTEYYGECAVMYRRVQLQGVKLRRR
jgi:hypothetical protein